MVFLFSIVLLLLLLLFLLIVVGITNLEGTFAPNNNLFVRSQS